MKKLICLSLAFMLTFTALTSNVSTVYAHPGRTDQYGGHTDSSTGLYHLHSDKEDDETLVNISQESNSDKVKGEDIGEFYGVIDGYIIGFQNFENELTSRTYTFKYNSDISKHTVTSEYKSQSDEYKNAFSEKYLEGYKLGYSLGINGLKKTPIELAVFAGGQLVEDTKLATGATSGETLGVSAGTIQAEIDIALGNGFIPEQSLENYEKEQSLYSRYNLNKFPETYNDIFINSFRKNYVISYQEKYLALMDDFNKQNFEYTRINNVESEFNYDLNLDSSHQNVRFQFPVGSVYGFGYIGGTRLIKPVVYDSKVLKFVNYDFIIDTFNTDNYGKAEFIEANKPFTMSVDHNSSSDNVGIYEFKNGAWQYILTDVEEGKITHTFPTGKYEGGRYCVFVEPNYPKFTDSYFSPFYDEIYTYARRRAIYAPTENFRPTSNITRGEFAFMINGIMNPNKEISPSKKFIDVTQTSPYKNSIDYVSSKGYINGVSSNQFGVNSALTYNQLKIIIERVTNETFDMNAVFNKMSNERLHKSKGVSNMNAYVTREEAVYILYSALN